MSKHWELLSNLKSIDLSSYDVVQEYSNSIRLLLDMALKIAIFHNNMKAVNAFLAFSKENMITLIIEQKDMDTLIATENFATIQNLV